MIRHRFLILILVVIFILTAAFYTLLSESVIGLSEIEKDTAKVAVKQREFPRNDDGGGGDNLVDDCHYDIDDNISPINANDLIIICNQTFDTSAVPNVTGQWVKGKKWYGSQICCGAGRDADICCGNFHHDPNCTRVVVPRRGTLCLDYGAYNDSYTWQKAATDNEVIENDNSCLSQNSSIFDKEKYCAALQERDVLMIGDSTMEQTSNIFRNALRGSSCQKLIYKYKLSDILIPLRNTSERGDDLATILQQHRATNNGKDPDIVILTAGAHIYHLCDFVKVITTVKKEIFPNFPKTTFVWKTQNPMGCSFPGPPKIFHPEDPTVAATNTSELLQNTFFTHPYHWRQMWIRDLIAISIFSQDDTNNKKSNNQILDVRMLYSRTDSHIFKYGRIEGLPLDCLHFRSPGPLDVIVCLFFQLLHKI